MRGSRLASGLVAGTFLCLALAVGTATGSAVGVADARGNQLQTATQPQTVTQTGASGLLPGPPDEPAAVSEPELDVFLADSTVPPGTERTVELTVLNTGSIERGSRLDEETATARGVSLSIDDEDAPVEVSTGDTGIGSIPPGEEATVPVRITAPASADGESGELDIDVEYTYTEVDSGADDETDSDSFDVEIAVDSGSRFEIQDADTDVQVGTDGTVEVDLENVGEADADSVRVSASSPTGGVTIGATNGEGQVTGPEQADISDEPDDENGGDAATTAATDAPTVSQPDDEGSAAFLGELEEDDSESVEFDTRIHSEFSVESYLLELRVVYEDEDGILRESPPIATAVEPTERQTFEIENVSSTLAVGDSGTITADLENTGPADAESPVVRADPASDRIDIGENRVAIADLAENESAEIAFDADVSGQADPGRRQITFTVEYGSGGERLESDPFIRQVNVAAEQPAFLVTAEDREVPAGSTETVELNVTNNGRQTLSNINVFLYPDGPLSVDSDEAFIPELEPGESQTVAVEISVDEGADQRAYPLEVDFRYDDETDDDLISQVYQVPITATEPATDDGLFPSFVFFGGLTALVVGTTVAIRRR